MHQQMPSMKQKSGYELITAQLYFSDAGLGVWDGILNTSAMLALQS
jgi:hypothetical protein